jgi:cobalamin biosynthesis Mg chelatase CobN
MSLIVGALVLGLTAAAISGCASASANTASVTSAASSASKQASGAATSAAAGAKSATRTATVTATSTAQPSATKTVTQPGATVSKNNSISITAHGTQTTPAKSDSGGGLPWWGWVLIALAAIAVLVAVFSAGRRRGGPPDPQ